MASRIIVVFDVHGEILSISMLKPGKLQHKNDWLMVRRRLSMRGIWWSGGLAGL